MSTTVAESAGGLASVIRPSDVEACRQAEAKWDDTYRDAVAFLAPLSRRYRDAEDVASVARVLLAGCMADGTTGASLAAARAVALAGKRLGRQAAEQGQVSETLGYAESVGAAEAEAADDRVTGLAAEAGTRTDRAALVNRADLWATLAGAAGIRPALLAGLLRPGSWGGQGRDADEVNISALARALGESVSGPARATLAAEVRAALAALLAASVDSLPAWLFGPCDGPQPLGCIAPAPAAREAGTRPLPESATASPCVRTGPDGLPWLMLADRASRLSPEAAAALLGRREGKWLAPAALLAPAYRVPGGASREADRVSLLGSDGRITRRAAGMGLGIPSGHAGSLSPDMAPAPRPVPSRRRKRDGAIGGPTVTGRTGLGSVGSPASDGQSRRATVPSLGHLGMTSAPVLFGPAPEGMVWPPMADDLAWHPEPLGSEGRRADLAAWREAGYPENLAPAGASLAG